VAIIDSVGGAETPADEWQALAAECGGGPFHLPGLALPWWRHLGRGQLRIVTVRNGAAS
jgi:CelD/BcsL family acetyltransferase involved in cellulose biosynthesis